MHSPRRQAKPPEEGKSSGFEACESSLKRILEDDDEEPEPKVSRGSLRSNGEKRQ